MSAAAIADCRCSHSAEAHEHYRKGSDCALCECSKLEAPVKCKHLAPTSNRLGGVVTCDACLEVVGEWKPPQPVATADPRREV